MPIDFPLTNTPSLDGKQVEQIAELLAAGWTLQEIVVVSGGESGLPEVHSAEEIVIGLRQAGWRIMPALRLEAVGKSYERYKVEQEFIRKCHQTKQPHLLKLLDESLTPEARREIISGPRPETSDLVE